MCERSCATQEKRNGGNVASPQGATGAPTCASQGAALCLVSYSARRGAVAVAGRTAKAHSCSDHGRWSCPVERDIFVTLYHSAADLIRRVISESCVNVLHSEEMENEESLFR